MYISLDCSFLFCSERNGADRARGFASAASNAFEMIAIFDGIDVHAAYFFAFPAVDAFVMVQTIAKHRYGIEERVDCAERTDVFAKRSVDHDGKEDRDREDRTFPVVQESDGASHGFIESNKRDSALEHADGTDEFTEKRRALPQDVDHKER